LNSQDDHILRLETNLRSGGKVFETNGITRLEIPSGTSGQYRLAQLDDYHGFGRASFPWRPPVHMALQARAASASIPGTWGFGFWNDPFEIEVAGGGSRLRLPALPNAAWFFFASPPNFLALNDSLPGNGFLAATFSSPLWPAWLLSPALLLAPLLLLPPAARLIRRMASRIVHQDAISLPNNVTTLHEYSLTWREGVVEFFLDGALVFETAISPVGRLGFVLWIDNQFMAFPPDGRLRYGTLKNPDPVWIEVFNLEISAAVT